MCNSVFHLGDNNESLSGTDPGSDLNTLEMKYGGISALHVAAARGMDNIVSFLVSR